MSTCYCTEQILLVIANTFCREWKSTLALQSVALKNQRAQSLVLILMNIYIFNLKPEVCFMSIGFFVISTENDDVFWVS